jgi:DNA-binding MarR family transcriptional regulator
MLEKYFLQVYTKFKLNFYKNIFSRFETREASLTAVETFCVEVIDTMNKPTINEFAKFVNISQANAAYKIQSLIEKGYLVKHRSTKDKREYLLSMTDRYYQYYALSTGYVNQVMQRMKERFSEEEIAQFQQMLKVMNDELMPEVHDDIVRGNRTK